MRQLICGQFRRQRLLQLILNFLAIGFGFQFGGQCSRKIGLQAAPGRIICLFLGCQLGFQTNNFIRCTRARLLGGT